MRNITRQILDFRFGALSFPLFLLALCIAAYGPLIDKLGFFWDDFPMAWIATTMGGDGLERYFSTNRPVWGLLYRVTTPLLGSQPAVWQIFAIVTRWCTGLALWLLLRQVWPSGAARGEVKGREDLAAWAAALFCLYPGFSQQYISFVYSHFYIVLTAFLLSLALMVLALRRPRWFWPLNAAALMLSLFNLLSMEYFFLLDLLRPVLIWLVLSDPCCERWVPDRRQRFKRTLLLWLPYLAAFGGAMAWRSLLFGFHTYQPTLMTRLKTQPLAALAQLIPLVLRDIWTTSAGALAAAFQIPAAEQIGARKLQFYWLLLASSAGMSAVYLLMFRPGPRPGEQADRHWSSKAAWLQEYAWAWQPAALGLLALLIAGGPFWLTDLQIGLVFSNDRFTLPFMLGTSLAAAALLLLLPAPRWLKTSLLGVTLGFAIGLQLQYATAYTWDWSAQRSMFWQLTWRAPDLRPGTLLVTNELPMLHYTDNSLAAPLNWIYGSDHQPEVMPYMLYYPTLRGSEDWLETRQKDVPIERDYLAARFYGSSSQMVALMYNPPGCLRVLDPQVDIYNWMVPGYLREVLELSTTDPILPEPAAGKPAPRLPDQVFGAEIARGWCYYFQKADLARQMGDWQTVASLGDEAFAGSDYPNDPLERFVFIEGYAHIAQWDRAVELTRDSLAVSPRVMQPMLCALWQRIEQNTENTPDQQAALQVVKNELQCSQETGQLVQ